jgi:molybdate transport system ATP-binding protein
MAGEIEVRFQGQLGNLELNIRFNIPNDGITAIYGPSGVGKTTVLRGLAGLEHLAGRLVVDTEVWQDERGFFRRPEHRAVGYVFQEPSLFPHLSVRGNLDYGYRRAVRRRAARAVTPEEVVELMGIRRLLSRATTTLSGGERQRVAIARALLAQPRLLLMDEPLASLDEWAKAEILPYLERLHESLRIPLIYVSHDMAEIERLADILVLMEPGRVLAVGPLAEILSDTALPAARSASAAVVAEVTVTGFDPDYQLTEMDLGGQTLQVPGRAGSPGAVRRVRIAAADVSLAREQPSRTSILNVLPARIERIDRLGSAQVNVVIGVGAPVPVRLLARISRRAEDTLALEPGQDVFAQVKAVSLVASGSGPRLRHDGLQ